MLPYRYKPFAKFAAVGSLRPEGGRAVGMGSTMLPGPWE